MLLFGQNWPILNENGCFGDLYVTEIIQTQFWKQDMAQSADTENNEEAEQLSVRNSCKLWSVHLRPLR